MSNFPIVQKYGGSSVASLERLRLIADKIAVLAQAGRAVVVVVSAMGKRTAELLDLAAQASATAGSNELPQRELDMLVSTGERVTMSLLSIILHGLGRKAVSFTGSQSGIITTDTHFDSRILEVRPNRIQRALQAGSIVVVAGYQGMSAQGEITTLGRGGSDTTAVALAGALGTPVCEIYSDVDGVYTSDPRRVGSALHLPQVGYQFMWEMSHAGARVLNQEAIRLAREFGVRVVARSSFPDAVGRETWVALDREAPPCRATVELSNVLEVSGDRVAYTRLQSELDGAGIGVQHYQNADGTWRGWLRDDPIRVRALERVTTGRLRVQPGRSLVSLIASAPGELRVAREQLGSFQKVVHASATRHSVLVAASRARKLTQKLHQSFVEGARFKASA
jgi:aspartate kinase